MAVRGVAIDIFKRERDHNTNWYDASDGTMERGDYLLRNWRGDTAAVLTDGGNIVEYAKYSAYGTEKGIPAGDCDNDGDVDNADAVIIFGWKNASTQDARGDLDLDGDVDAADLTLWTPLNGNTLGRGALSLVGIRSGYAGYQIDPAISTMYHVRARKYSTELGRFLSRDPMGYSDGPNLYQYARSAPVISLDPSGLIARTVCEGPKIYRPGSSSPKHLRHEVIGGWKYGQFRNYLVNGKMGKGFKRFDLKSIVDVTQTHTTLDAYHLFTVKNFVTIYPKTGPSQQSLLYSDSIIADFGIDIECTEGGTPFVFGPRPGSNPAMSPSSIPGFKIAAALVWDAALIGPMRDAGMVLRVTVEGKAGFDSNISWEEETEIGIEVEPIPGIGITGSKKWILKGGESKSRINNSAGAFYWYCPCTCVDCEP